MNSPDDRSAQPTTTEQPPAPQATRRRKPALWRQIDAHYNDIIVVIIALVTVLASLVAFLQAWADNHYAQDIRLSQTLAMEALGHDMRSRLRENHDIFLYTTWNEWDWRRVRAPTDVVEARNKQMVDMIAPLTPLLDEDKPYYDPESDYVDIYAYHADVNVVTTTSILEQRAFAIQTASRWNSKSDGYITVLTLLAVALFLYGLSTTIKTDLRYLFALVGTVLVGLSSLWTLQLTLAPVPTIPYEAIAAYARGQGAYHAGAYEEAKQAFDSALEAYPDYGNAYKARAEIYLDDGDYQKAAQDYEQAITYGTDDVGTYWNLGWTYYLTGDYAASLKTSRKALESDPDLLPVIMNVATALLAQGETEAAMAEYERGLQLAADPDTDTPPSWNHLYIRETVNDLNRLINTLDGEHGFYQEPDLSDVDDHDDLREAAVAARSRLKGGLVAIEATGSPDIAATSTTLSPITFSRHIGWRGELLGQGDTFSRALLSIAAVLDYEALPSGAILSRRVTHLDWDGVLEHLPTMGADIAWEKPAQGTITHEMPSPWPGSRGFLPGIYTVEYYVNGNLLQTGQFTIPEEDTSIVGPIVFASDSTPNGIPFGPSDIFPAGVEKVEGLFKYSGLPDNTTTYGLWYRNDQLYDRSSSLRSGWGSEYFYIKDVPAGNYRLDIYVEGEETPRQSATCQVVDVATYLEVVGGGRDDALFQRNLGDAYANSGDDQQANFHYQRAVELDPTCDQCYYRWWSALYDQGSYREAAQKLERAIALKPRFYSYRTDLGETYLKAGDDEHAVDAFRQAVPAAPAYTYNAWANALFSAERYEEAASKYQQAIELEPDNAVYWANLGGAYRELGEIDLTIEQYEQAVALDPDYAWVLNEWGNLLYNEGDYEGAAEKYRRAAEAEPSNAVYFANLGGAYYQLDEYTLAVSAYEQAIALDPAYAYAYNGWGNALYAQGDYAGAAERYEQATAYAPDDEVYWANLGGAYYHLDEYDLAVSAYEQAVAIDPAYARAYNGWGNVLYAQGDYAGAAERYEQATTYAPDDEVYWANLGGAYSKLGEYGRAAAAYEQAVAIDPAYASAYNGWGNALYAQGDYAGAAQQYQQAIALLPTVPVYHYNLGLAYYHLLETDKAIAEFELAAELAAEQGDLGLVEDAEEMLDQLQG